ncbi:MAG: FAD-dependent oxidoreductase [Acidobacteria bacterium]|nr:FAD-dependent oxidoreductase [Acidobacteriota bacterium]
MLRVALALFLSAYGLTAAETADLVVYGGTAGGVATAVSAAREGLDVILLEPRDHLGGMLTGGLSESDIGKREVLGGIALEFFWRVGQAYQVSRQRNEVAWNFEPHVGEQVLREMLQQAGVRVLYRHRLREKGGVRKQGLRVAAITTEDGTQFEAKVFADCSYEGDLMAQAGVRYTWGRESTAEYGESLAGVRDRTPKHQWLVDVSPYDAAGKLLPEISPLPKGEPGSADKRVQAYNFRIIATDRPGNRLPWPKPEGYDPGRYALMARLIEATVAKTGHVPVMHQVLKLDHIPGDKVDINNQGAFSTDYIGASWDYPEGSYARKAEIWRAHEDYVKGLFYFLANDPAVPKSLRDEVSNWGLPRDEYVDNGHFPNQLYIREARRMVGEFVMTQKDLQTELTKPDAIGMGSYNSDSHNLHRFVNERGFVENEGDMQVPVTPYQMPYRVMLPNRGEAENLLVPVAFSASHVAYSSLRMEPQYMILGHAAGVAAALAVSGGQPVQAIDVPTLQEKLREQGAMFEYTPSPQSQVIRRFRSLFCGPSEPRHGFEAGETLLCN